MSKSVTGLDDNTTYYVRAFATNGHGTSYSDEKSFSTPELPKYTITYNAGSGSCATSTWTQPSYEASTTLPTATAPTTCSGWEFEGWCTSSAGDAEDNTTSPGTILTGSYTPTADVTLYAIYTHSESGGSSSYNKVTSAPTDWTGDYLIVYETGALCFDANLATGSVDAIGNTQEVTISNNSIASTSTVDNYRWTVESVTGGYNIKSAKNGYYIGNTAQKNSSADNGLTRSASSSTDDGYVLTLAWDGTNNLPTIKAVKNGNTFLIYNNTSNQTRFRFYKSATCNAGVGTGEYKALSLFKKASSTTKYYMTSLVCCSPLGSINGSVSVSQEKGVITATLTLTEELAGAASYVFKLYSNANTLLATKDPIAVVANQTEYSCTFGSADGVEIGNTYKVSVTPMGNGTTHSMLTCFNSTHLNLPGGNILSRNFLNLLVSEKRKSQFLMRLIFLKQQVAEIFLLLFLFVRDIPSWVGIPIPPRPQPLTQQEQLSVV